MPEAGDNVFIIGGTAGLGLATAKAVVAAGARVTIAGRGAERAAEIAHSIGTSATGLHIDLEDSASIKAALSAGDPVDHLILTAIYGPNLSIRTIDYAEAARATRVKVLGYVEAINTILPRLKPTSSIVLFGGLAKANPYPGSTMVSIVNGAIVGMLRTLAVELAPIRVNAISPGLVENSPRWIKRSAEGGQPAINAMKARTPSRRLASVEDIVHAVLFLMDNRAANGIDLELDGGIQLV